MLWIYRNLFIHSSVDDQWGAFRFTFVLMMFYFILFTHMFFFGICFPFSWITKEKNFWKSHWTLKSTAALFLKVAISFYTPVKTYKRTNCSTFSPSIFLSLAICMFYCNFIVVLISKHKNNAICIALWWLVMLNSFSCAHWPFF